MLDDRQGRGGAGACRTIGRANLAVPRDRKNLTDNSGTLSTGYKTAANFVAAAKLKQRPALIECAVELK
jgi:hypothetical protein